MHVFDRDLLLALAAMAIEGVEQNGKAARELVGLIQIFPMPFKRLLAEHGDSNFKSSAKRWLTELGA